MPVSALIEIDSTTFYRAVGLIGFGIYVTSFLCLSLGKIHSRQPIYFILVLTASSCVLTSLWVDFNLSAALIQVFYIAMSAGAIVLRLRGKQAAEAYEPVSVPVDDAPVFQGTAMPFLRTDKNRPGTLILKAPSTR